MEKSRIMAQPKREQKKSELLITFWFCNGDVGGSCLEITKKNRNLFEFKNF